MGNPLDLPGPQFLVFYGVTVVLTLGLLYLARAAGEGGDPPRIDASDPYLIAYLRGGTSEALRVATVALIDRGVLEANPSAGTVLARRPDVRLRRPLEQALVRHFEQPHPAASVFGDQSLAATCEEYERRLACLGLLADTARRRARRWWLALALLALLGLSVAKIAVALSRGRGNVGFLVVMTVLAVYLAVKIATPRLTTRGRALLADLRRLFARLRTARIEPGGASADAALLAAVFGLGALPGLDFAYARALYPRPPSTGSAHACGSSGGSSCGGGGGGGGGCGGCGSGGGD